MGRERNSPKGEGIYFNVISVIPKKKTSAPPKEGRGRQHHTKGGGNRREKEERTTAQKEGREGEVPLFFSGASLLWVVLRSFCLLLGGAAWTPPSFGGAAFLTRFCVLLVPRQHEQHHTKRPREKAPLPKGGKVRLHYPNGEGKSSHTQRMGKEDSTTHEERESSNTTQRRKSTVKTQK